MRILLVDDDDAMILVCRRYFLKQGAEVECCQTPQTALEALRRHEFDVVLCDYQLRADMTGVDVLAECARLRPRARRILMSGVADAAVLRDAEARARIEAFVEKPMSGRELVEAVGRSVFRAPGAPDAAPPPPRRDPPAEPPGGGQGLMHLPDPLALGPSVWLR